MKPTVFVASSRESLEAARAVQSNLDGDASVIVWDQSVFPLVKSTLDGLLDLLAESDFGIFICGADDIVRSRPRARTPTAPDPNAMISPRSTARRWWCRDGRRRQPRRA